MPQAIWNEKVIADSEETIIIEGNHYFPPDSIKNEFFKPSQHKTVCSWKGEASYYDIDVDDQTNSDAAWYYHNPEEASLDRTGRDFTDYVAFWRGVEVK